MFKYSLMIQSFISIYRLWGLTVNREGQGKGLVGVYDSFYLGFCRSCHLRDYLFTWHHPVCIMLNFKLSIISNITHYSIEICHFSCENQQLPLKIQLRIFGKSALGLFSNLWAACVYVLFCGCSSCLILRWVRSL